MTGFEKADKHVIFGWLGVMGKFSTLVIFVALIFCGCNSQENTELRIAFTNMNPHITTWDNAFGEHEVIHLFKDSPDQEVYTIGWLGINSIGDYIINDAKIRKIYQFDKTGKFIRTIGRQGLGPGEFEIPRFPQFDKNDNLYFFDSRKRKILKFSVPNYEFETDFKIDRSAQDLYLDDDGSFIIYSLYSMDYNDVLFKMTCKGEILRTAYSPKFKDFRVFVSRFQIGGFDFLENTNELLFLYPFDYELCIYDRDLNLKRVLYSKRNSYFTPNGVPFPKKYNPYDYNPRIAKWWGEKVHPIRPFDLGNGLFLVRVSEYDNLKTKSYANIHDIKGNTYAEGLEIPYSFIRYSKDGYVYIVEDSSFDENGDITPLRLHRYKFKIKKR